MLVEMILLKGVDLVMILRLEELDDVTVHRPDRRGRGVDCVGQGRTGQLGLAGKPVQEVERRNSGGWHQALNLRELLDYRVILLVNLLIVVSIIVQPAQKFGLLGGGLFRVESY